AAPTCSATPCSPSTSGSRGEPPGERPDRAAVGGGVEHGERDHLEDAREPRRQCLPEQLRDHLRVVLEHPAPPGPEHHRRVAVTRRAADSVVSFTTSSRVGRPAGTTCGSAASGGYGTVPRLAASTRCRTWTVSPAGFVYRPAARMPSVSSAIRAALLRVRFMS